MQSISVWIEGIIALLVWGALYAEPHGHGLLFACLMVLWLVGGVALLLLAGVIAVVRRVGAKLKPGFPSAPGATPARVPAELLDAARRNREKHASQRGDTGDAGGVL